MKNRERVNFDVLGGRPIITSRHYSEGSVYLLDMTNNTWCVVQTNCDNDECVSKRIFIFSDDTKKEVWRDCMVYFKTIKESLMKKRS